jgi:hypothetical protein
MGARPSHLIIAGVNKAATTSTFVALSAQPGIAPAAVKETRYFLPARYGEPLAPISVYDELFSAAAPDDVRLEATPSYIYGKDAVASAIDTALADPRIVMVLREPVARAISFFEYQKVRLRFPADLPIEDYLAQADALSDAAFQDPDNERYMAVRGGCYADFLPAWFDRFGIERMRVVASETLVSDPASVLGPLVSWCGLAPDPDVTTAFASENRTTGFRSAGLQRLALLGNDRMERFLRRHGGLRRRARALYYRFNGRRAGTPVSDAVREELADRFAKPNRRLAALLATHGVDPPPWLEAVPHAGAEGITAPRRDQGRASTP